MSSKVIQAYLLIAVVFCLIDTRTVYAHEITFCGEKIPVSDNFVAEKLMDVIRKQIPQVNLPQLRKRALANFPVVEYYLRATNLPEDFKYLAIVESGFVNQTSKAGAGGFWQFMPSVAKEYGLTVTEDFDERNDIYKSTLAACKHLANYYLAIRKRYNISSWVLTAAAYNVGIGRIFEAVNKQGKDYFTMKLNPETAVYVYKIIAVKELFEYPEFYMKNFNYNVFSSAPAPQKVEQDNKTADSNTFDTMTVKVSENDGQHPESLPSIKEVGYVAENQVTKIITQPASKKTKLIAANIKGKYKNFEDGKVISIELQEDLKVKNRFVRAGNTIRGVGWIINDRVFIDLGFDDHQVILYDSNSKQGIELSSLKNDEPLLLKVEIPDQ
jgi:hypothetical protein